MTENRIDLTKKLEDIRRMYEEASGTGNFSCLTMGLFGAGKTSFICTGRKPILIDSFDPRGTIVLNTNETFKKMQERGELFIRTFWTERSDSPSEFKKWQKTWNDDIQSGFLSNFGTYGLDSLTTFIDALSWQVSNLKGRGEGKLAIQDYIPIYNTIKDIVKITSTQDVDFVVTGHLVNVQDELTGEITAELDTYKRLKTQIPILFTEKYVLQEKKQASGIKYTLLTQPKGRFRASTQLGAGNKFKPEEEPDIKVLLKKAGLSIEDKVLVDKENENEEDVS